MKKLKEYWKFIKSNNESEHQQRISKEQTTTNIHDALWIVSQTNGTIRYVINNLYLRKGDVCHPKQNYSTREEP